MTSPPGLLLASLLLLALHLCPSAAKKEENSITDEVDLCKGEPQSRKTCEMCAAKLGQGFTVSSCCADNDVMNQCQFSLRKKRDVNSDELQSSENEALYEALTNPRVVSQADSFLDKRARYMLGKRPRNNFLGKRNSDLEDAMPLIDYLKQDEKRSRLRPRPLLGKRDYDDDTFMDSLDEEEMQDDNDAVIKRATRYMLGKRDDDKRAARYMLGKREDDKRAARYMLGKREDDKRAARYMLGKREDDKRASRYMLGKREEDKRAARYMLGKREDEKRASRYMLGKREDDKRAARYMLGKRDNEKRAARYMLGKREDDKRAARYMLGKREDDGTFDDDVVKRRRYMLGKRPQDDDFSKRRRYMLGKRSVDSDTESHED